MCIRDRAYTNDAILVHYKVVEDSVRAKYGEDNGSVSVSYTHL